MRTLPATGRQMPVSTFANVVLPAPEGPITPSAVPGVALNEIARSTG